MRFPSSTYRLQIRESFTLDAAAELVDYLAELGADWAYLSPLLKSATGSDHGYDVVDHSLVDPARGGRDALDRFAAAARARGLGILIDIVPNHVGVADARENSWWWDVLKLGRSSRFADYFDIDWDAGHGRVRLPILGGTLEDALANGELRLSGEELRYFDTVLPLAPGTSSADPATTVAAQNYELMNWRRADAELNYRRFFAVNTLAAIRVELPEVFEASHVEILRWIRSGLADGLRVDHPDGLADPGRYLDDIAAATGNAPVWVEKILEGCEQLPATWATAGTTGYDALGDIDRVLVDPRGRAPLDALDARLRGLAQPVEWATLIHETKRAVADGILRSEVLRLVRELPVGTPLPGLVEGRLADTVAELLACFPVYRSYLPLGAAHLIEAADLARRRRPELSATIDELLPILSDPTQPAAIRFQQTSGMVMAKGVEDTAFYRYNRLSSLTEVGGDPAEFSIGVSEFHSRQLHRQAGHPSSLTALTTHDTKRGEDTRARITVLSEMPENWEATLGRLHDLAPLSDGGLAELLWESIVGTWPASRERLQEYATKAAREAGNTTNWTSPNSAFEAELHALVDSVFDNPELTDVVAGLVGRIRQAGWSNSLTAKLIQLTAPGIPDVYQGSELWESSLVDPDNRRVVDFELRRRLLRSIERDLPAIDESGAAKLLVTTRALRLRRDRPELFTRYVPLTLLGDAARHAVAFDRGGAISLGTRLPLGLAERGWGGTELVLPGHPLVDVITGRQLHGGLQPVAELLADYPVALLIPAES
jgi:(1->4)-alpha-D-glucan 1-alpha-D-glucosylmutase